METLQWAVGILVIVLMGMMGWFATQLWGHVVECRQLMARLEGITRDVERMKQDIGTHETGMRGHLHKTAQIVQEHEITLRELRRK